MLLQFLPITDSPLQHGHQRLSNLVGEKNASRLKSWPHVVADSVAGTALENQRRGLETSEAEVLEDMDMEDMHKEVPASECYSPFFLTESAAVVGLGEEEVSEHTAGPLCQSLIPSPGDTQT